MSHTLSSQEKEQLELLRQFQGAVWNWHHRETENPRELRSWINQNLRKVKQLVSDAGCGITLTISPPPAVGGLIMREVDPFDTIFNPPYLQSLVPVISDMIDQTIGVIERGELKKQSELERSGKPSKTVKVDNTSVFVVHGRDNEAKHEVARLLERLKLKPIVLHEQPSRGKTIIEKIEHYSGVAFAVVILSPDDVGALATEQAKLNPRARQNVILELGYMVAKLGRDRVCALVKQGVEIPSDFDGVVYVSMDWNGAWKFEVGKELKAAGITVDLNAIA
jgi:predicted nucleotide-binding protein